MPPSLERAVWLSSLFPSLWYATPSSTATASAPLLLWSDLHRTRLTQIGPYLRIQCLSFERLWASHSVRRAVPKSTAQRTE